MPIIIHSERKTLYSRVIITGCYILLIIGGITMVVPFMLMFSGSFKGKLDAYTYDFIPAFIYNDNVLFLRYLEEKYNERIQDYQIATGDNSPKFELIKVPERPTGALVKDWEAFCATDTSVSSYQLGLLTATFAAGSRINPRNLRAFRYYMRDLCNGDINIFRQKYSPKLKNWFYMETKPERLLDRNYTLEPNNNMTEAFNEFKASRHYSDRIYLSVDGDYRKKARAAEIYQNNINKFNELNGTHYRSFDEIIIPDTAPKGNERRFWEKYVRKNLNVQFINVSPDALPNYAAFLEHEYKKIENLNKRYRSEYRSFAEVPFPDNKIYSTPAYFDFVTFLSEEQWLPLEFISLQTPELKWRALLKEKYRNLDDLRETHQRNYASFSAISMPQKEMDYYYVLNNIKDLRWHYITRNYKMVFDYVSVYGRGIINTVVYCLLAIIAALTVNPLAAYALSRYNLPSQYKVLLFFIATIAFPAMVTMIPSYLLLKDLGLLNTFAALVLPGLANGYAIFLLKGFFDSLPRELYETADIEGASEWFKFWYITINLSKPILAVIALGAFTAAYGNFAYAFVLCQDSDMWTLMVWLYQLQYHTTQGVQFASLLIAAVPTLVVFIFAQRIIIQGIVVPVEK